MIDDKKVFIPLRKELLSSEKKELKQKRKRTVLIVFLCILFLLIGTGLGIFLYGQLHRGTNSDSAVLNEIEYIMENYWLYANDHDDLRSELEDKAFYGMTYFEEDPYTTYMSADEVVEFSSSINMDYVGIGVQFSLHNDIASVDRVFMDSPAMEAGMQVGDIIVKIDGIEITGMTTSEIKELVLGEEGTYVNIEVNRGGQSVELSIKRAEIDSSVYVYAQDNYVFLELMSFGVNTGTACMNYLNEYEDYDRIVIDLRDNTGGYQSSVEEIAGLFIGDNEIYMTQKDAFGNELIDRTSCRKTFANFKKIVILTNSRTASAAEVLTICLKEQHDDVTIVGETTYGKGVIQSNHTLMNGGNIKFTSYNWYSPNGVSINGVGITPDIEVLLPDIMYEYEPIMSDDAILEYDCVDAIVRFVEMELDYLDYDIDRTDGYFDESLVEALTVFRAENGLGEGGIIDKKTYNALYSKVSYEAYSNEDRDSQKAKAIELMKG